MRLFIAIRLNEEAAQAVEGVKEVLRWQNIQGKYTPRENLHVTLAFIGEYGDPDEILDLMQKVSFKSFSITMDKVGCFDELWWTGLEESNELETLVKSIRHVLADAGIPYDKKKFKAHVTFLRKPVYANGRRIAHMSIEPASMQVSRISLMRSTRGKNGMIYTELGSVAAQ